MYPCNTIQITGEVPFPNTMFDWVRTRRALRAECPMTHSHEYDPNYLAWEQVRIKRNPYFEKGTGFEGYFIGVCRTPEDALDRILNVSQRMLDSIAQLYPYAYNFRSKLMKTLTGDLSDVRSIAEWASLFGAALGRLRVNLLDNYPAEIFHAETYAIIQNLPPINYVENCYALHQTYLIGYYTEPKRSKIVVQSSLLKPSQQDAWLVAQDIGKFGHPLVREFVKENSR